jgi:hypothetical protein
VSLDRTNRSNVYLKNKFIGTSICINNSKSEGWILKSEEEGSPERGLTMHYTWQAEADHKCVNVGTYFTFLDWHKEDYLFSPAALYNGNRYERQYVEHYPPMFDKDNRPTAKETNIITDVPGLELKGSKSFVQLASGDSAVPLVGAWLKNKNQAVYILTTQESNFGLNGFDITEDLSEGTMEIGVMAPIVKREVQYSILNRTKRVSQYRGIDIKSGTSLDQEIIFYSLPCQDTHQFFQEYFQIWHKNLDKRSPDNELPFSTAWELYLNQLNKFQWNEKNHYYRIGFPDNPAAGKISFQDWQPGWVGGGMNSLAALQEGDQKSKERAMATLDYLTGAAQCKSGLFYGVIHNGQVYGDDFYNPENRDFHLVRKSGDGLYYLLKHFYLCQKRNIPLKNRWVTGAEKAARAFVQIWRENGQFGQFVGTESLEIKVGGSAAGASAIAALAQSSDFFNVPGYLHVAEEAAEYYYQEFLSQGIVNGGPGEILQGADSESIYALLESFIILYELTGQDKYLDWAEKTCWHYSSWVVNYQYKYPSKSQFGIHRLDSRGSVFANVQNKHSSPHICTFSGDALFKLYRYTSDERYMDLLYYTVHNAVNYFSREDRPIYSWDSVPEALNPGVMCERVNLSDWEGLKNIGGVFNGQCWCSVSSALSWCDLPGVYVDKEKSRVWNFDHIQSSWQNGELTLKNTTRFSCTVKLCFEGNQDRKVILGQAIGVDYKKIDLLPGQEKTVPVQ